VRNRLPQWEDKAGLGSDTSSVPLHSLSIYIPFYPTCHDAHRLRSNFEIRDPANFCNRDIDRALVPLATSLLVTTSTLA
jgi:hypothetical protein